MSKSEFPVKLSPVTVEFSVQILQHGCMCSLAPGHCTWKAQKYQNTGSEPSSILSLTGLLQTFFCLFHKQWPINQHSSASHGNEWSTREEKYSTGLARLCPPHGSTPHPSTRPAHPVPSLTENSSFPKTKIAAFPSNMLKKTSNIGGLLISFSTQGHTANS